MGRMIGEILLVVLMTKNSISHAPFISTNHLIKSTIQILEKYGLKQGVEFKVPSKSWVSLNFTSNNGQRHTANRYTGRLTLIRVLQYRELQNYHHHGHYNANMKHLWWCNMSHLHDLVEEASTITISTTGGGG